MRVKCTHDWQCHYENKNLPRYVKYETKQIHWCKFCGNLRKTSNDNDKTYYRTTPKDKGSDV